MTIESFENPESRTLKSWGSRWEWLSTYFWEVLYNSCTCVMLKKIMTSTPVALNRVWHCSRKSCIKCTTYRLVSYLLAVTVSTLQYFVPPKFCITIVFHFSRVQCITAVPRETENNAYAKFSGGNAPYLIRCIMGDLQVVNEKKK